MSDAAYYVLTAKDFKEIRRALDILAKNRSKGGIIIAAESVLQGALKLVMPLYDPEAIEQLTECSMADCHGLYDPEDLPEGADPDLCPECQTVDKYAEGDRLHDEAVDEREGA